jgi:Na+/proline symporter
MTPLLFIIGYLCLLIGLGVVSKKVFRGTAKDYFLASNSIGPVVLLMSVFGTTMTAFALVGSTGEAYRTGIGTYGKMASWSGIIHSAVFFLVGIRLWAYGKRYGYCTQIQYFRDRFQSKAIGYLLFPILVGLVIPYLLIGLLGAGSVVESITAGAFPKAFEKPAKMLTDSHGIKTELDQAKRVYWQAVLAQAEAEDPVNDMRYRELAEQVRTGGAFRPPFEQAPILKEGARMATPEALQLLATFVRSEKRAAEVASELKESDNWKARTGGAASYKKKAKSIKRERLLFSEHGIVQIQPDEISNPLNGGVPKWLTGLVICGVVLFYVFFGGLRGAAWANTMQTIVFMICGVVTFFFISYKLGGAKAASELVMEWNSEAMTREKINPIQFLTYMFVPLSIGMFPHVFQHWLTAKNAKTFQLTCVAHPIFVLIVWVPCVLVGVWATAAIMPGSAAFDLVVPIEHPKNTELALMVKRLAQPALAGLLSAGILAAIMSSLDSQFLCLGSMFTNDIVLHDADPDKYSDKQKVLIGRCFVVAVVAVCYGLSLLEPRRVFTLGVWCFSGFGGLFPIVFLSLYWKRMTKVGAFAGIIAAIAVWIWAFARAGYGLGYGLLSFTLGDRVIDGIMPAAAVFAACLAVTVIVSLFTRPPSQETIDRFFIGLDEA